MQLSELVRESCPYVFAARPVFVEAAQARRIAEVIRAVESVVALPAYRDAWRVASIWNAVGALGNIAAQVTTPRSGGGSTV